MNISCKCSHATQTVVPQKYIWFYPPNQKFNQSESKNLFICRWICSYAGEFALLLPWVLEQKWMPKIFCDTNFVV